MGIDRVAVKEAAHQRDFGRKQVQTTGNGLGVFTENTRALFDDLIYPRVASGCGFKYDRSQQRDLVFVRRLRPADKFIKIVQRKGVQDFLSERHFTTMQIVFA